MDGAAADAEAGRASGEDAGGQEPSGPAGTRLALKTTPRCVADAPSAWRGYGSGLRPLAVALSRLTRVPAVCGRVVLQCDFACAGLKDDMFAAALHG